VSAVGAGDRVILGLGVTVPTSVLIQESGFDPVWKWLTGREQDHSIRDADHGTAAVSPVPASAERMGCRLSGGNQKTGKNRPKVIANTSNHL